MHNRSDQFSKNLLRDALSRASAPETEVEVQAATQKIDVYAVPDPARAAERAQMGELGELFREPSLFEPFCNTPNLGRVRRCLCKQLTWHHELERRARAATGVSAEDSDADAPQIILFPWLIVISPGRPETVLGLYGCEPVRAGVYEAVAGLQMRVVVLAELPRTRETLLLRLLGSGRLLAEVLADLAALPADAWEKSIATPLLIHFGLRIDRPVNEEDDMSAEIQAWFEDYQQKLRAEARKEGRAEEAARSVLTVLQVRGIDIREVERERILHQTDLERLERWLQKAAIAPSLAQVLDEPS